MIELTMLMLSDPMLTVLTVSAAIAVVLYIMALKTKGDREDA